MHGPVVNDLVPRVVRREDFQGRQHLIRLFRVEFDGLRKGRHLCGTDSFEPFPIDFHMAATGVRVTRINRRKPKIAEVQRWRRTGSGDVPVLNAGQIRTRFVVVPKQSQINSKVVNSRLQRERCVGPRSEVFRCSVFKRDRDLDVLFGRVQHIDGKLSKGPPVAQLQTTHAKRVTTGKRDLQYPAAELRILFQFQRGFVFEGGIVRHLAFAEREQQRVRRCNAVRRRDEKHKDD